MLELKTFYWQGNPVTVYLMGMPTQQNEAWQTTQYLFSLDMFQVLQSLGLVSTEDLQDCDRRIEIVNRFGIAEKIINTEGISPFSKKIPVAFRYFACIARLLPREEYRADILAFAYMLESYLEQVNKLCNKFIDKCTLGTKYSSIAELQRFIYLETISANLDREKAVRIGLNVTEFHDENVLITEANLAKYLKMSRSKLRDKLVKINMLERKVIGLRSYYDYTPIGSGYGCDNRNVRKWHMSVAKLLDNPEFM